jgi:hypothetical protein
MRFLVVVLLYVTLGSLLLAFGTSVEAGRTEAPHVTFYESPFDYCRALGTIDQPDGSLVELSQTPEMVRAIADAWIMPPDAEFRRLPPTLTWRCMDGQVYVCTYGANIPCGAKANVDLNPTAEMTRWCQTPPSNLPPGMPLFLPAYLTGRTTVYSWVCEDGSALTYGEPTPVDAAGYIKRFWYLVAE